MLSTFPPLLPPAEWWSAVATAGGVHLHTGMPYDKRMGASRFRIATAEGPLLLTVPLQGGRPQRGCSLAEIRIDHSLRWPVKHWRTLFSAYGRAPYFEQYGPALETWILTKHEFLTEMALAAIRWMGEALLPGVPRIIDHGPANLSVVSPRSAIAPYHQVFGDRHGYLSDLAALDLLMNEGPQASSFLGVG